MRGIGRASSAFTIVNALPSGLGAASAIDLGCQVTAEIQRVGAGELPSLTVAPADSQLVRAAVGTALRSYAPIENHHVRLTIESEIPVGRGFKSSSAVTVAIFEAIASARGHLPPAEELARHSAELCRNLGISASGAFDDALAAAAGGIVLTDNRRDLAVASAEWDEELRAILLVPPQSHPPSPQLAARFAEFHDESVRAFEEARAGQFHEAMARNSRLVEAAMGYRVGKLRTELLKLGARSVCVSGMGPGLVALGAPAAERAISERLAHEPGSVLVTGLRRGGEPARWRGERGGAP